MGMDATLVPGCLSTSQGEPDPLPVSPAGHSCQPLGPLAACLRSPLTCVHVALNLLRPQVGHRSLSASENSISVSRDLRTVSHTSRVMCHRFRVALLPGEAPLGCLSTWP